MPGTHPFTPAQSEAQKLHALQMTQPFALMGSWEWDINSDLVLWTDPMFQLHELPVTANNYVSFALANRFSHPDDVPRLKILLEKVMAGERIEFEYRIVLKNNTVKRLYAWSAPVFDEAGRAVIGVRGSVQDITRLREVEDQRLALHQKLAQQHELLLKAEEIAGMGTWQWNLVKDELYFSENLFRLMGYGPDAFPHTFENFLKCVHPDDHTTVINSGRKALEDHQPSVNEFRFVQPDGQVVYVRGTGVLQEQNGEKIILGVTINITAEKQAAEKLRVSDAFSRKLLELLPYIVYVFDLQEERVIFVNQAATQIVGIAAEVIPDLSFNPFLERIHPEDINLVLRQSERWKALHDTEILEMDYRIHDHQNQWRNMHTREIVFQRGDDGRVLQILGLALDVTEIKRTNRQLMRLNDLFKQKNYEITQKHKELATFTALASHDLKEPVRKILLFIERMLALPELAGQPTPLWMLERMKTSASRMQRLIDDWVVFVQLDGPGKEKYEVDLFQLCRECAVSQCEKMKVPPTCIVIQPIGLAAIREDHARILLENLLNNALKFTRKGHLPEVEVFADVVERLHPDFPDDHRPRVFKMIAVRDKGIGFDPKYAEQIFDIFSRLHTEEAFPGIGTGLAICKKITGFYNGFINASGEPGKGAVFSVFLPA